MSSLTQLSHRIKVCNTMKHGHLIASDDLFAGKWWYFLWEISHKNGKMTEMCHAFYSSRWEINFFFLAEKSTDWKIFSHWNSKMYFPPICVYRQRCRAGRTVFECTFAIVSLCMIFAGVAVVRNERWICAPSPVISIVEFRCANGMLSRWWNVKNGSLFHRTLHAQCRTNLYCVTFSSQLLKKDRKTWAELSSWFMFWKKSSINFRVELWFCSWHAYL